MSIKTTYKDLKSIDYKDAWDYQEALFNKVLKKKGESNDHEGELIFCEHPHVYTLGKSGAKNNLLINEEFLNKIQATYYEINRGGDITYHGPGQIVAYPVLDLERFDLRIKEYVFRLEQVIINVLLEYGIESDRLEGATGVWLDVGVKGKERKICAMGVRVSRWVSMHGFAFNVNTDLNYFNHINPCGYVDKGVTSLEKELGRKIDMEQVKGKLQMQFSTVFDMELV